MIKVNYLWISLLVVIAIAATTASFNWAMMGMSTFFLAYISKGSRRYSQKQIEPTKNHIQD